MTLMIPFEAGEKNMTWIGLTDALAAGHDLPKAMISDSFLYRGEDTLLQRQAWIDGLGIGVKSATVFPGNPDLGHPSVNGAMSLFDDRLGTLAAIVDFHLVTKWKTAGDSLLAARRLARPDSERILIVGAGNVARALYDAYRAVFPKARFSVWNRTRANAVKLADGCANMDVVDDLEAAVRGADIVTSATMVTSPILDGAWLQPGQHIDLIGAYRPDMREMNDEGIRRARLFVDSKDTTIGHIGEIETPLQNRVITRDDILGDYYNLAAFTRADDDITLFKNGGGAHLDLMVARYILECFQGGAA